MLTPFTDPWELVVESVGNYWKNNATYLAPLGKVYISEVGGEGAPVSGTVPIPYVIIEIGEASRVGGTNNSKYFEAPVIFKIYAGPRLNIRNLMARLNGWLVNAEANSSAEMTTTRSNVTGLVIQSSEMVQDDPNTWHGEMEVSVSLAIQGR
jgi:hypothetical protein